jgi:hypothetical protein
VAVSRSRYVLCRPSDAPIELNIYESQDLGGIFITYWIRVFQHFEELSSFSGLTFYVVWNYSLVRDLPSYGDDVVAILLTDEERIIPHYLRKVRFVFKAYGFRPWCGAVLWGQPPVAIAKCVREWMTWASHLVSFLRESGLSVSRDGGLVVPLGYAQQTDEPGKDFETRRYTVGFLGSVENKERVPLSLHALLGTPKLIARTRMIEGLQRLTAADPERVFFGTTGSFTDSIRRAASAIRKSWLIRRSPWRLAGRQWRLIASLKRCGRAASSSATGCLRTGSIRVARRSRSTTGATWRRRSKPYQRTPNDCWICTAVR